VSKTNLAPDSGNLDLNGTHAPVAGSSDYGRWNTQKYQTKRWADEAEGRHPPLP